MTLPELCRQLLAMPSSLRLDDIQGDTHGLQVVGTLTAATAVCPDCQQSATRIHSAYQRTLADVPWALRPLRVVLRVRRFVCPTPTCARQTFTERLATLAPPYARATPRLAQIQARTGLALGGAAGARLLARQGMPISRNTVLRRVRHWPTPPAPAPRVIGIDDWAWRKGQRYGTIVVDLERRHPLDLLDDRTTATVATWLRAHPTVEIVARDRSEAYAAGIRQGAPEATQVADRFHLVTNMATALQEVFRAYAPLLAAVGKPPAPVTPQDATGAPPVATSPPLSRAQQQIALTRARRLAEYEQARALRQQGYAINAIAAQMGRNRRTVKRYLDAATFPERQPRRRRFPSLLAPYQAYLLERWQAGCHQATQLFQEIQRQGFRGHYSIVAAYTSGLRAAAERRTLRRGAPSVASPDVPKPLTPRRAAWLVIRRETTLSTDDKQQLTQLQAQEGAIAQAIALTHEFTALVRQRQPGQLESWLQRAAASGLQALQSFAQGLRADDEAVKASLTLPWSNGPVEGQINRLKMLKRQMYGRASIALLRQRVLAPP